MIKTFFIKKDLNKFEEIDRTNINDNKDNTPADSKSENFSDFEAELNSLNPFFKNWLKKYDELNDQAYRLQDNIKELYKLSGEKPNDFILPFKEDPPLQMNTFVKRRDEFE